MRTTMRPKVLLITDHTDLPLLGMQMLLLSGVEVRSCEPRFATDGISGDSLNDHDLVLISMHERIRESVEICRQLRTKYDKPILVLRYQEDEDFLLDVYAAGADDCLVEPNNGRLFWALVRAWLRRAQISARL